MKGNYIKYSDDELSWLKSNRPMVISDYANSFNAKFDRDISKQNINALRKRMGWSTGRNGQFKKGNVPHPNSGAKSANKTSFKKGLVPHNHRPVGSKRISRDNLVEIKIDEPRSWDRLHSVIYKEANGEIPQGKFVVFIDGDKRNFDIENLVAVTRAENLMINRYRSKLDFSQFGDTGVLLGKLTAKLSESRRLSA